MNHLKPLFFLLLLPITLLLLLSITDAETTKFVDCSATSLSCGMPKELTISYPFRKPGMPEYCGHPNFEISCVNSVSTIVIGKKEYQVQDIDYDSQFLSVSDLAYSGDFCPQTFTNTTTDFLFIYSNISIQLTMYFNCSDISDTSKFKNISCLENRHVGYHSFYMLPNDDDYVSVDELLEKCSSVIVIPIYGDDAIPLEKGRVDFLGALQNGFGLNWTVGKEWCGGCQDSAGVCGFDPTAPDAHTCFCRDGGTADGTCHRDKGSRTTKVIAIAASVGGTVALIVVVCCIAIWYKRRKRLKRSGVSNLLSQSTSSKLSSKKDAELGDSSYHTHIFSYDELQEATNGFDSSRELGDGGFGTVYKGTLRDGRTVAVKRLYENNYRRLEQFMNEVAILSRLRHQNLVTLYGCTSRHSRELLLVYEFVPNGTIADHLHGTHASTGPLPWNTRMSIAIETAYALAYLHAVEPQIIHRDVKSTNILLDNNFHVKVADFGLSRLFPLDVTHVSTAPQGTPGYVDPEYHQCYQLTDKSDVYSFGVVLVELISSKPAVDISRSRHEINLANMAVTKIQNRQLDQLVDPLLGYQSDTEVTRMITQVAELAFTCLQSDRDLRPSIKEVLQVLKTIDIGSYEVEKSEVAEAQIKEETILLKNASPFSPDSVTEKWQSSLTTPNNSG